MTRRSSIITLGLLFAVLSFCTWMALGQKFDYDFEKYFPTGDAELKYYLEHRKTFGSDNDFLLVAIENDKGIFNRGFLQRVDSATKYFRTIPHVTKAEGPTTINRVVLDPFGKIEIPYINLSDTSDLQNDSVLISESKGLVRNFFGKEGKSVCIYLETEHVSKDEADKILTNMEEMGTKLFHSEKVRIGGKIKIYREYISRMLRDFFLFTGCSLILIIIFLSIGFRTFWGVWVPVLTVLFAIIGILGVMKVFGQSIDLILTMLPTFIFVVGMSDVVHIISEYLDELRKGKEKLLAIRSAFKEVALATFLTCITTAAGFLTLLTADIKPIRNFGIFTALGVILAYIFAFTFLPAILSILPKPRVGKKDADKMFWASFLHRLFTKVIRRPKTILLVFGIALLISVAGIFRLKINRFFLEDLPDSAELKKDNAWFEKNFAGLKPFEMAIWNHNKEGNVFDYAFLRELEKIESYLEKDYKLESVISPLTIVKGINEAKNGGNPEYFKLPASEKENKRDRKLLKSATKKNEFAPIVTSDWKLGRLTAKGDDIGSAEAKKRVASLDSFYHTSIDTNIFKYHLTGGALLVDRNNESVSKDLAGSMFIEFSIVALIVGFMFGSIRMILISLIPNVVPLIFVAGIMGWAGIDLKVTTSMIFSIVFGIAVDDTLHILTKLKLEMRKGKHPMTALKRAYLSTGKAVMLTSVILVGGFLSPMASDFSSIFYTGLLVSLSLFFAVLSDLFLLPILLLIFFEGKKRRMVVRLRSLTKNEE